MEDLGVISHVKEPNQWCAAMVFLPTPLGSIRICVDLKPLNESVIHEIHALPKVGITLTQLSGAKFFTKLNFNSGFL